MTFGRARFASLSEEDRRLVTPVKSEPCTCYSNHPSDGYATLECSSDEGEHNQAQGRHLSVLE